jgi:hypothetical protein
MEPLHRRWLLLPLLLQVPQAGGITAYRDSVSHKTLALLPLLLLLLPLQAPQAGEIAAYSRFIVLTNPCIAAAAAAAAGAPGW